MMEGKHSIVDIYARWFLKQLRKEMVLNWENSKNLEPLELPDKIQNLIQILESQLNESRKQPYTHFTGNYQDGHLNNAVLSFFSTFKSIIHTIEKNI